MWANSDVFLQGPHSVFEFFVLLSENLVFVLGLFLLLASGVSTSLGGRVVLLAPEPILFVFDDAAASFVSRRRVTAETVAARRARRLDTEV